MSAGQAGSAETAPADAAACACGPGCTEAPGPAPVHRDATWRAAARNARLLAWFSLGYMAVEGMVAIVAAVVAGSVALLGFGLDSVIEGLASVIIVWRYELAHPVRDRRGPRAEGGGGHLLHPGPVHRL